MPATPDAVPSPSLEAARERVVRLLTDRYADDTLTVEEFEARLDRLHALTDAAALDRMADELVTGVRPAGIRPAVGPDGSPTMPVPSLPPAALGWQRGALVPARVPDDGRVVAIMSASRRAGPWAVPRVLRVWAVMSEAVVDLRDAVLPAEGCEIEVGAVMANVRVLLPPGVDAQVDVLAFMGAAHDHTRAGRPETPLARHVPCVRVTGSSVMAEVQVFGS